MRSVLAAAIGLLVLAAPAVTHELSETSATVVVRDGGHVELRLQVPWADVLHAQLMPKVGMMEFLAHTTSQPLAVFAAQIQKVRGEVERETELSVVGRTVAFSHWQWPSPDEIQDALRREQMSRLAEGGAFAHHSRLPAYGEVVLLREPSAVQLKLARLLGPALLTVYRPGEQWVAAGTRSHSMPVPKPSP